MGTNEDTVKSYEASAAEYAAEAASMPEWVAGEIEAFVDALGGIGRILEIGSAGGRDALELERRGLSVRCTDVAQRFVDLLRADGFGADRLDPLTDDLADPQHPDTPYDGVLCLPVPCRPRGPRHRARSARQVDQVRWSNPCVVRRRRRRGSVHQRHPDAPRCYTDTLWRERGLRSQFSAAGWVVDEVGSHGDKPWLKVRAHRP